MMNSAVPSISNATLPSTAMSNSSQESTRMTLVWIKPMTK